MLKVTTTDGQVMFIPEVENNGHYRIVLNWLDAGNIITPPPPKQIPTDRPSTAYLPHPLFKLPNDGARKVWRYMSFEQLFSMLRNSALWFTRGNVLRNMEPYEGQLPALNINADPAEIFKNFIPNRELNQKELANLTRGHRINQESIRVNALINCWNMLEYESYAVWKVYGKGNNSIAIVSDINGLKSSFGNYKDYDVFIGEINYIDYKKEKIDETNYLGLFLHKTPFYSSESELRCIIIDDGDNCLFPDSEPVFWGVEDAKRLSPGTFVPIDMNTLIKEIVVGPLANPWFVGEVKKLRELFQLSNASVRLSEINGSNA